MYTIVCPNCGEKSEKHVQYCPVCGTEKSEPATEGNLFKDINDALVKKLSFLDYPQVFVTVFTRLVIMFILINIIPGFISNSEFFWMIIGIFSVYGIIRESAPSYKHGILVYKVCRTLLFAYFGAGFGNLVAHAGTMAYFRFSYYFNPGFLFDQLITGKFIIIVGAIAGIGVMILYYKFRNDLETEE